MKCELKAIRALFLAFAMCGGSASNALAQDSSRGRPDSSGLARYRLRVLGVFDQTSGEPIEGAEVFDVSTGWSAKTTKTGTVSLFFMPDGGGLVRIRKVGYQPLVTGIAISTKDTAPVTLLIARVTELPKMVVSDTARLYISGNLNGFEERRRAGFGHFISDSALRALEGETMSAVLARLPGATLQNGHLISTRVPTKGPVLGGHVAGLHCPVSVYLDGVLLTPPPDFSKQSTDTYAGVEFYASNTTAPVWISASNSQCGVLLLWTRER